MAPSGSNVGNLRVYFEVRSVGMFSKVVAIDEKTGTEVTVMGSKNQSPYVLRSLAFRKLLYVLRGKGDVRLIP